MFQNFLFALGYALGSEVRLFKRDMRRLFGKESSVPGTTSLRNEVSKGWRTPNQLQGARGKQFL